MPVQLPLGHKTRQIVAYQPDVSQAKFPLPTFGAIIPSRPDQVPLRPTLPNIPAWRMAVALAGKALTGQFGYLRRVGQFYKHNRNLQQRVAAMRNGELPMTPENLKGALHSLNRAEHHIKKLAKLIGVDPQKATIDEALTAVFQSLGGRRAHIVTPSLDAPLLGEKTLKTLQRSAERSRIAFQGFTVPDAFQAITKATRLNTPFSESIQTLETMESAIVAQA
ncbi:MAG: hypothetical protein KC475_07875 [Cyanobacteria bacterium HKST-UBA03]|nr:hypothetical protein [Cyanobacteria bacterium HKST-UBA03]